MPRLSSSFVDRQQQNTSQHQQMAYADLVVGPLKYSSASCVYDPDGLLSNAGKIAIEKVLRQSPDQTVFTLFRSLANVVTHMSGVFPSMAQANSKDHHSIKPESLIFQLAKLLFNLWNVGDRKKGVLYVLALQDRRHHLYMGRELLEKYPQRLRETILEAGVGSLRRGNVDQAVLAIAKRLVLQHQSLSEKVQNILALWSKAIRALWLSLIVGGSVFYMGRRIHSYIKQRWSRRADRALREARLQQAWARIPHQDGSRFHCPCVVCIEPLTTVAKDWATELSLARRGFLQTKASENENALPLLVRLPATLQRHVLAFVGPSLRDFSQSLQDHGKASAQGLELLRCGHVLHDTCADTWLSRRNVCPMCRLDDPRITAIATLPAAFAAAQLTRNATAHNTVVDLLDPVDWVGDTIAQPPSTYVEHTSQAAGEVVSHASNSAHHGTSDVLSVVGSIISAIGDDGGAGTTGDW